MSNVETRTYLDESEQPILNQHGYSTVKTLFDTNGFPIKRRYFSHINGVLTPVMHIHGNYGYDSFFDECGNEIKRVFVDENGKPTKIVTGVYGKTMTYDKDSFKLASISNIDSDGNLTADIDGYVTEKYLYDTNGVQTYSLYYDINDKPIKNVDGVHGSRYFFERKEGKIISRNVDENLNFIIDNNGVAGNISCFNEKKQLVELYEIDLAGNIIDQNDEATIKVLTYNDQNRIQTVKSFDSKYKLISGFFVELNKEGSHVRYMFPLDVNGVSIDEESGANGFEYIYMDSTNFLTSFVNGSKVHIRHKEGYYAMRKKEDDRGRITEIDYYDLDGNPMPDNDGIYGMRNVYLEDGTVRQTYVDSEGTPMEDANMLCTTLIKQENGIKTISVFDKDDRPISFNGWHKKFKKKPSMKIAQFANHIILI